MKYKSRGEQNDFKMKNKSSSPKQDKKKIHTNKVIDNIFIEFIQKILMNFIKRTVIYYHRLNCY